MAEASESSSNGEVKLTYGQRAAADRAAFVAGEPDGETAEAEKPAKGKPADANESADDDNDLDEVDSDAEETSDDESDKDDDSDDEAAEEDDDKDLDDEDEVNAKADAKIDPDVAKRLEQVRRTDRRLRDQRDRQFAQQKAQIDAALAEWQPKIDRAVKFERLAARADIDPAGVLEALGVKPDRFEYISQLLYTIAKGKDDPKSRDAAARLIRERERDEEISNLKKWREERESTDKQREQSAAQEREVERYLDTVVKAASDKTPLAKRYIAKSPDRARGDLVKIAHRIGEETGATPSPKAVMIAFEKERRRFLRDHGIDPKSASASAANSNGSETKTAPKQDDKKTNAKTKAKVDTTDDDKPLTKEAFMRGNYD